MIGFHAAQMELGGGSVGRHITAEAAEELLDHPVGQLFLRAYAGTYYERIPKIHQVAEIAAAIASGQHSITPEQAHEWFDQYIGHLERQHGQEKVAPIARESIR